MNLRSVTGCHAHPDEPAWVHAFNPLGEKPCDPCLWALLNASRGRPDLRVVKNDNPPPLTADSAEGRVEA